ncbi:MAG TPA: hypothetical protein VE959_33230 [Bryobacteraceae bacterium]|nr:hypothetical protein [Bryobacteraceae bacterium]
MTSRIAVPVALAALMLASGSAKAQFAQQGAKLVGTGAMGPANQGNAVALSSDGNTLAVGGSGDNNGLGAVWVFTRINGVWSQQGSKLTDSTADPFTNLGLAVAISADGNTVIAGGPGEGMFGAAWVFTRANGVWSQQGDSLVGTGSAGTSNQGLSIALSADGNTAVVGGPTDGAAGAVWVFTRANGVWSQQGGKLTGTGAQDASTQGDSVALSADGNTLLVGGSSDNGGLGAAWVFTRSNGVWSQQGGKLVGTGAAGSSNQGIAAALSADGNTALVGGDQDNNSAGAAWIFTRANGVWTQQGGKLIGTGAQGAADQGFAGALSGDGNTAVMGGFSDNLTGGFDSTGATWIFTRTNGFWSQHGGKLVGTGGVHGVLSGGVPDGPAQGYSVALSSDGSTLAVGGNGDDSDAGATWIFVPLHFSVLAPSTATGGTPFNFMVSALDADNVLVPAYTGTVHFTSSDAAAVLPADSMLSAGVRNLSATLRTGGNQTITATDAANSGITGTSSAIAVSGSTIPPAAVSVSPAGGNTSSQTFTFVYTDPRGFQDLGVLNILVNNFLDGRHACYLAYVVPSNTLVLVDDAGDAAGPYAAGIQNSQCAVTLVSAVGSGNNLTLTLTIGFTAAFAGDKIVQVAARDVSQNNSGWQPLGVWRVPGGTQTTTTAVVAAIPSRGTGTGPAQFTFTFSDTNGFADLGVENILVNGSLDGGHACYVAVSRRAMCCTW